MCGNCRWWRACTRAPLTSVTSAPWRLTGRRALSWFSWTSSDGFPCCGGRCGGWRPGFATITTTGQIGDGREAAAVDYVLENARAGDVDDVLATIDKFAYEKSMLINVGDEKGLLLDAAVRRADPTLALELGTYCGYGALRIARAAPERQGVLRRTRRSQRRQRPPDLGPRRRRRPGDVCRRHHRRRRAHPGRAGRRARIHLGCARFRVPRPRQGRLPGRPAEHPRPGLAASGLDRGRRQRRVPGAPKYREYMRQQQGKLWNTVEHKAHVEYQCWSPTWCWSPTTWASDSPNVDLSSKCGNSPDTRRSAQSYAPAGGLRPTLRAARAR